jgi:N-acetylmuramoyl-L-alanine amidase
MVFLKNKNKLKFQSSSKEKYFLWLLPFLSLLFAAFFVPEKKDDADTIRTVVLDAGHGGKDPGNLGTKRYKKTEKDVTLSVTKLVGSYIEKNCPDVKVIYTREGDSYPELHERTKLANRSLADLFISIHCDAIVKPEVQGASTYVMGPAKSQANLDMAIRENKAMLLEEDYKKNYNGFDPSSPEGLIELNLRQSAFIEQSLYLAKKVQDQFKSKVGRKDRGVKQAPFWVISFTTMPSILIELGYLTNKEEEDFLQSEIGQEYLASAIYRAFKDYKEEIEGKKIEPVKEVATIAKPDSTKEIEKEIKETEKIIPIKNSTKDIIFKVQLTTSTSKIEINTTTFNGLENVEEYKADDNYKYTFGNEKSIEKIKLLQEKARKAGFPGAFVVAFQNNEKIDLQKAVELTKKKK